MRYPGFHQESSSDFYRRSLYYFTSVVINIDLSHGILREKIEDMNFKAGAMPYDPLSVHDRRPIPLPHVPSANMLRLTIAYNTRTITLRSRTDRSLRIFFRTRPQARRTGPSIVWRIPIDYR